MRTVIITLSDELEAELKRYVAEYGERELSSIVEDALLQFLPEPRVWRGVRYRPAQKRPFHITPAEVGSGLSDVSINHDKYLAEAIEERAFSERNRES